MSATLEKKVDRLIRLLEDKEAASYNQQSVANQRMIQELVLNTVLASAVGYFMFRILDYHFRPQPRSSKKKSKKK